jgi:glycosyltransferase involved in cell wall biosynthesis
MILRALLPPYALLAAILTAYLVAFAVAAVRARRPTRSRGRRAPRPQERVSVIIPVANEEALLGACLDSLLAQDLSRVDAVIVAVNGSSDRTESILDAYARRHPLIGKVVLPKSSKVEAILAGMRRAPSRHVLLLDADMELGRGAVAKLAEFHFAAGHPVSTCLIDPLTKNTPVAKLISCDRLFRAKILNVARAAWGMANVPGNIFMVDKVLYRTLMQRDTLLEDNEFTYQLWAWGKGAAYLTEVLAYERERLSLTNLVRQRKRWVLGNIDTFGSYLKSLETLPAEKRIVAASYPLLWYIIHYALAVGSALAAFDRGWAAAYLVLLAAYGGCVVLSLSLRATARTQAFTALDAGAHALVFPWAVTLATALALGQLLFEARALRPEKNRASFLRDELTAIRA